MRRSFRYFTALLLSAQFLSVKISAGSYDAYSILNRKPPAGPATGFQLSSPVFDIYGMIPAKYTCDGEDLSPPLEWTEPPAGTVHLAIICEDVDLGRRDTKTRTHWILYRIPATTRRLKAGVPNQTSLPDGSKQGINDFSKTGYTGPCTPSGTHRYNFKLYALNKSITPSPMMTKNQLEHFMRGHILAEAPLTGIYQRQK